MLEAITFSGYQIRGADIIGFDLIPGSFLLSERSLKALEKAVVLFTASFLQATAIFSAEQKKMNLQIASYHIGSSLRHPRE